MSKVFIAPIILLLVSLSRKSFGKISAPLVLVYETDAKQLEKSRSNFIFQQLEELPTRTALQGNTRVVGTGKQWNGWGSKAKHIAEELSKPDVHPDQLVVVSDSRDVLANNLDTEAVERLVANYESLTADKPGAIVVGAEKQCCVAAMTHSHPGSFLADDLTRKSQQACNSGQSNCLHRGDEHQRPWIEKLEHIAKQRGTASKNLYPNSGIIVGTAKNIKAVYDILDMKETEDDQALFTELMIKRPNLVVMDYDQKIIGNNVWTKGMAGCIFEWMPSKGAFVHPQTQSIPAFLHFQGKFFECYGKMAKRLGFEGDMRRKLAESGPNNYGGPRVVFEQTMRLTDQMTVEEGQTAVNLLNSNKEAVALSLYAELTVSNATIVMGDAFIQSYQAVSARRLADPAAVLQDLEIRFPYTVEVPQLQENVANTELSQWSQSTPSGITAAVNSQSGRTFQVLVTEPVVQKESSASSIVLSNLLVSLAIVFMCH